MIEPKGVVHFTIPVSDVVKSEHFYCDILGLKVVQRASSIGMLFLQAGSDYVILCHSRTPIDPNPGKEIMIHHSFCIDVDAYADAVAELRANGVEILFEEDRREGVFQGRQVYFHDPDRNVIELVALERIGQGFGVDNVPERKTHFVNKPPGM
jgi:catechol 2,3-dioxygenase-like lactoylglutathione lyase family enzyme